MKIKTLAAVGAVLALPAVFTQAAPLGTAFTYQGRLTDGGNPANGSYDLKLTLYDDASGGNAVAGPITNSAVGVTNGLFTTTLDFGNGVFTGDARWLEIGVRTNGQGGDFTVLDPRQPLTPAPYALFAPTAGTAATVPAANLTGTIADTRLSPNVALLNSNVTFNGTVQAARFAGNGAALSSLNVEAVGPPGTFSLAWLGFTLAPSFSVGAYPRSVVTADVNGDGCVDLVSANSGANSLTVLTNNRSGGFVLAASPAVGLNPYAVATADVNGDGCVDLVSANYEAGTLTVLTNNRRGGFALAASPAVGFFPTAVAAADVNGDGWVDLVSANYEADTLTVLTNNQRGGFVSAAVPGVGSSPSAVIAADLNRDGWVDLVSANYGDHTLTVLTNNRAGGFVVVGALGPVYGARSVAAADVNGDTWVDLISANQNVSALSVLLNRGGVTADLLTITGPLGLGCLPTNNRLEVSGTVSATGFRGNGAGLTDLSAANLVGSVANAQLPTANLVGTIADARLSPNVALLNAHQTFSGANRLVHPGNVFVGQYVGDGGRLTNLSLLTMNSGGAIRMNNSFSAPTQYHTAGSPTAAIAADVDGDGRVDLVSAGSDLIVLTNRGNGSFGLYCSVHAPNQPGAVVAADFNGDGLADLACAGLTELRVLTNSPTHAERFLESGHMNLSDVRALVAADVNDDGRMDLITIGDNTATLSVWTNRGNARFGLVPSGNLHSHASRSLAVADVNGDGWVDCIAAGGQDVTVLINDGHGGFGLMRWFEMSGADLVSVVAGDLNADGRPDLAVLDVAGRLLRVLLHDPTGNFTLASSIPVPPETRALAASDLNGDGHLDLIAGTTGFEGRISVFANDGHGQFSLSATLNAGHNICLLAADVNGDGAPDVVSLDGAAESFAVFLGRWQVIWSGYFSGTFVGDGAGLTNVPPAGSSPVAATPAGRSLTAEPAGGAVNAPIAELQRRVAEVEKSLAELRSLVKSPTQKVNGGAP